MSAWPRIAKLVPLLGSDKDGEVLATVAAIARILEASSATWHDMAKALGGTVDEPPKDALNGSDLLAFMAGIKVLSDWERSFVEGCRKHALRRPLSERQMEVLATIAERHGWKQ